MKYQKFLQSTSTPANILQGIQDKLSKRQERLVDRTKIIQEVREGAVLFPLLYPAELEMKKMRGTELLENMYTLLIKRSKKMKHNPGDMAFPGGKQDEGDSSLVMTALREAQEEIGLVPSQVQVLGSMDEFLSSGFVVARTIIAAVAIDVPPNHFRDTIEHIYSPKTQEAEATVAIPLNHFFLQDKYTSRTLKMRHRTGIVRFFDLDDLLFNAHLWGLTASMIKRFLDILFEDNPLPKD